MKNNYPRIVLYDLMTEHIFLIMLTFSEHDWCMVGDLDAIVRPRGPFISTMEATERVTMSLVIPMILAILHATSRHVSIEVFEYASVEFTNIHIKEHSKLTTEVQELRKISYHTNN
jgi:hypothetical protein